MNYRSNRKKHMSRGIALLLVTLTFFTGCSNKIPQMSAEEEEAVGEYAAMLLLKYDAKHRSRLVDLSQIPEEPPKESAAPSAEPEPAQEPDGMRPVEDTPVVDKTQNDGVESADSLEAFFEFPEGVTLTYQEMQVCASYPEDQADDYFTLDASEGKSLLVLHYNLSNQSQTAQDIDLLSREPVFKVTVNETYKKTALMTMLLNDMSTYMGSIAPGESQDLVLLVEIDQELGNSIASVSINIKNESKTCTISIL